MTMFFAPDAMVDAAVIVTVAVVPGAIDAGLMLPVKPAAAVAVSETLFWAPPLFVTLTVKEVVLPGSTVPWLADGVSTKSIFGVVVLEPPPPHAATSNDPYTAPDPVA